MHKFSWLSHTLTQPFFRKPPTTFLTCFCRGERRKFAGKKSRLNRGSNSQPPGHECDTLTTEPPARGTVLTEACCLINAVYRTYLQTFNNPEGGRVLKTIVEKGEIVGYQTEKADMYHMTEIYTCLN